VVVAGLYREFYELKAPGTWADRFCEQAALLWMRCDQHASVTDFATHKGHSKIGHLFCDEVMAAVARLDERVRNTRSTINSFGNS
jgi:hypothetical protein